MQLQLLEGLAHVFAKTYLSRDHVTAFLTGLASTDKLSPGKKPADIWRKSNFLRIQQGGSSQKDLLAVFDEVLRKVHGFGLADAGSADGMFVYLDDCMGTGNRVRSDICTWLEGDAPQQAELHIVIPVFYTGSWWIDSKIAETAKANGKEITIKKWRLDNFHMENRLAYRNTSDVLWPTKIPDEPAVQSYGKYLDERGHPARLRTPGGSAASGIFKDDAQRIFLEQALLIRGCQIRQNNPHLPETLRPLGYHNLDCFGFGSMFVTYRNCPNNCPLAFWVQQAEYPALLPRKTNTQTADEKLLKELLG
jgi:hypothetical protein